MSMAPQSMDYSFDWIVCTKSNLLTTILILCERVNWWNVMTTAGPYTPVLLIIINNTFVCVYFECNGFCMLNRVMLHHCNTAHNNLYNKNCLTNAFRLISRINLFASAFINFNYIRNDGLFIMWLYIIKQ